MRLRLISTAFAISLLPAVPPPRQSKLGGAARCLQNLRKQHRQMLIWEQSLGIELVQQLPQRRFPRFVGPRHSAKKARRLPYRARSPGSISLLRCRARPSCRSPTMWRRFAPCWSVTRRRASITRAGKSGQLYRPPGAIPAMGLITPVV